MKFLLSTVFSAIWLMTGSVLANDRMNDGAGPSNPQSNDEFCMTNDNIEVLFNIIFGLNVNHNPNSLTEQILPERTLRELNVVHIIYRDQFRILLNGVFVNDNISMGNLETRVVHFLQRVMLRMKEMLFEASRSASDAYRRQDIEYVVNVEDCSIDFSFDCRFSARNLVWENEPFFDDQEPTRRCDLTVQSYRKNNCSINTVKFAENSDQNLPWNSDSMLLDYVGSVLPCILLSCLSQETYEERMNNMDLLQLRSRLAVIVWNLNRETRGSNGTRWDTRRRGLNINLESMIVNDQYFEEVVKLPVVGHAKILVHDQNSDNSTDHQEDYSTGSPYISEMIDAFEKILREDNRPRRLKRYTSTAKKPEVTIRQRLIDFAFVSLEDQIEANSLQTSLPWSKDFNQLYDQFLKQNWANVLCPNNKFHRGFDNFLYSRFSQHPNWQECISGSFIKDKWCSAIRRIIFNTDLERKNRWLNVSPKPARFLRDRITVYKMLIETSATNLKPSNTNVIDDEVPKTNNFYFNNDIFNLALVFLTFAQINPCIGKSSYARVKRDIEPKWFLDSQGHFQCT